MLDMHWATGDFMDLLSARQVRDLLRDAGIANHRVTRNRLLGFTVDFVVTFGERSGRPGRSG
jgi:hypothetical protein